ncbi:MAG TPA: hypothetical protein VJX95_02580, partial [Oscillospiraceae bacterium]|nr:hypothetical protein [Oscillospiraceae bacterium]
SETRDSVYEHCKRAMEHSYKLGEHELPLMGSGDWNDGYNGVGIEGKGESVWLALFMAITFERFSEVAKHRGDGRFEHECKDRATRLKQSVEEHCWDGQWYIRAFYDNGDKMGSHEQKECQIDSLSQSFAALAKLTNYQRISIALTNAMERLVDSKGRLIRLFTPAITAKGQRAGYVASYPPGIRENGGQYTHGAIWFVMALYEAGEREYAYELVEMLSPAHKHLSKPLSERYRNEPYYMSADVYTNYDCYGRGGWSIYTGAASWYYKLILEHILGIRRKGDTITVSPAIPSKWSGFNAKMRFGESEITLALTRGNNKGMIIDGKESERNVVVLDGNSHNVQVII